MKALGEGTAFSLPLAIVCAAGTAILIGVIGASAWFHWNIPPGCESPETISRVLRALRERHGAPAQAELRQIRTVAGGIMAVRFVCAAELAGAGPPGSDPLRVSYASRLNDRHHEVSVTVEPAMKWQKVQ